MNFVSEKTFKASCVLCIVLFAMNFYLPEKVSIFLIGDSTMSNKLAGDEPEKGWGQLFPEYFNDQVLIENHAKNGRSTKSFINEGLWKKVLDRIKPGDFVLIQFGHNDSKASDSTRYAEANITYKNNLINYILETRNKGGIPVLITPVNRRKFDEHGNFVDQHGDYPKVVREVAAELNVHLIDLHESSLKLFSELGADESKKLFLYVKPGFYTKYPDGKEDDTHFNEYGARIVAELVVEEIKKMNTHLSDFLIEK